MDKTSLILVKYQHFSEIKRKNAEKYFPECNKFRPIIKNEKKILI